MGSKARFNRSVSYGGMRYGAVSFDAAGTLIDVAWDPASIAVESALLAGLDLPDRQGAGETYGRMLHSRWGTFQELNRQRSSELCDGFWRELGVDWLARIGQPAEAIGKVSAIADRLIFGPESKVFRLFPDTLGCLEEIRGLGVPVILLSNWDVSLHRVCGMLGLTDFFDHVIASLEEGIEKPDPGLFQIAQDRVGVSAILHIGDDPLADIHGARSFGWDALLLDRGNPSARGQIQSLSEVAGHL